MMKIVRLIFTFFLSAHAANIAYAKTCVEWFEFYQIERAALLRESGDVLDKKLKAHDEQRNEIFFQCEMEAKQGIVAAQTILARLYFNGIGVDKSMNDAHYWYIVAAKNGSKEGAVVIANAFLYGKFFRQDMYISYYWNLVARKEQRSFEKEFCDFYNEKLSRDKIFWAEKTLENEYGIKDLPSCLK